MTGSYILHLLCSFLKFLSNKHSTNVVYNTRQLYNTCQKTMIYYELLLILRKHLSDYDVIVKHKWYM